MTTPIEERRGELIQSVFRMPAVQTMVSRKSSITNAFVNSVIPVITPTSSEIAEALEILGLNPSDLRCAYCGDKSTEWDHLRPLVIKRRPTGYISEIANLVPACGKCNQSKGNKAWRDWMLSKARLSPTGRGLNDIAGRISRLDAYENWRTPTLVNFDQVIGSEQWEKYWELCEAVVEELRSCQQSAESIKNEINEWLRQSKPGTDH